MPGDTAVSLKKVYDALSDGSLSGDEANACVTRILAATEKFATASKTESFDRDGHAELAARVATDSAVLMKNDGTLPLDRTKPLCVIGELFENMRYQGSGSSMILPTKVVTHKDAFDVRGIKYGYARGYSAGVDPAEGNPIAEAVALAEKYDTVLLYLGLTDLAESEGGDREHIRLPDDQLALADALMKTGKKIVVVLSGGSPVELPFAGGVNAVLNLYLPGQCGGEAGARLLFGEVNPSGKLAETWYKHYADVPYGEEYSKKANEFYKESVFVGYRYAKTAKVSPAFPFGFGLSYTDFEYQNLAVTSENGIVTATLTVRNTGNRDGAEVVQLYVKNNENSAVFKPESELRAFRKVYLKAGEETVVTLSCALSELSFWNIKTNSWTLENGEYTIEVGASSEDIRLTAPLTVAEGVTATSPYPDSVNEKMKGAKPVDNAAFADLLGTPLPDEPPVLPLTMESRFCDFRKTFMGRILYNAVCGVAKRQLKKAKKLPAGPERDNRIKGAIFLQRIFDTNCVRTLSLSAGKSMPWNIAEGFVQLGNGHLIRGIAAMCQSYKIKGADES